MGARLWGNTGNLTIPYTYRFNLSFSTNTTQATAFFFYPDIVYGQTYQVAVAGTMTLPALAAFVGGPSVGTVDSGRVVSAGFILRNVTKALDVEGSYYVVPMTKYAVGDSFAGAPPLMDSRCEVIQATKGAEVAVNCMRRGYGALDFHDPLTGVAADHQPDYQIWMVYFNPTTTVQKYEIETFVHIEYTPDFAGMPIMGAINNVSESPSSAIGTLADRVTRGAKQVVWKAGGGAAEALGRGIGRLALRAAGAAVGAALGGPSGAAMGYATIGDIIPVDVD